MPATTPVYWLHSGRWADHLGIAARPRGGDWLDDEVEAWQQAGVTGVVSLLTSDETSEFHLQNEGSDCRAHGIEFKNFPVPDRDVPQDGTSFDEVVESLRQSLGAGKKIVIHCRQGIGRSSLLAASILVSDGESPEAAFQQIETARGRPVPDTEAQRLWVRDHAA